MEGGGGFGLASNYTKYFSPYAVFLWSAWWQRNLSSSGATLASDVIKLTGQNKRNERLREEEGVRF